MIPRSSFGPIVNRRLEQPSRILYSGEDSFFPSRPGIISRRGRLRCGG